MIFTDEILARFKEHLGSDLFFYSIANLFKRNLTRTMISNFMFHSCAAMISDDYIQKVCSKLKNTDEFDMVCVCNTALDTTYKKKPNMGFTEQNVYNAKIANLTNSVLGFIILQKGECKLYPNVYAVNLICSHKNKGKLLLTLALYAIVTNTSVTDKRCVLELANAYINAPGLCMYSKLGFRHDPALKSSSCFADLHNLPMIVDLSADNESTIIAKFTNSATSEKICAYNGKKTHQKWLGYMYNLQYLLDSGANISQKPYNISANEEVSYVKLFEYFGNDRNLLDATVTEIESNPNYNFDAIDAYVQPTEPKLEVQPPVVAEPVIEVRRHTRRAMSPIKTPLNARSRSRSRSPVRSSRRQTKRV